MKDNPTRSPSATASETDYDALVFIGRFQPVHNGHVSIIREALKRTSRLIVLIGSSNVARSPRNPFNYEERVNHIWRVAEEIGEKKRLSIAPIPDTPYNDSAWLANVQKAVYDIAPQEAKIALIGHAKDHTSYYLKMFPEWGAINVAAHFGAINTTQIRKDYLSPNARLPGSHICPEAVIHRLESFVETPEFVWLTKEAEFYADYKAQWSGAPYPPFICCADAVVIQSGHILLVERGMRPGKSLLALPGGHVEQNETFRDAAIRELREETRISDGKGEIPPAMLSSFIVDSKTRLFDHPHRSERGRVVTQAVLFDMPNHRTLFRIKGSDDAKHARWTPLGTLRSDMLFEDHAAIIEEMTGAVLD